MAAVNPEQPIITKVLPNNRKVALYIPNDEITCQYYRDVKVGDVVPDGHIITQYDIDNGDYRRVGFNCASETVNWMRDTIKDPNYYTFNPLDVYDFIIDDDGNHLFDDNGEGNTDCAESCFTQGSSACYECAGGTTGGGQGGSGTGDGTTDDDDLNIVNKCCQAYTSGPNIDFSVPGNDGEFGTYGACNAVDCGYDAFGDGDGPGDGNEYVHYEPLCKYPLGEFGTPLPNPTFVNDLQLSGKGHNIVWNQFNYHQGLANTSNGDPYRYYPYWNHGSGTYGKMYYKDGNDGGSTDDEFWGGDTHYFNQRIDKRQKGVNLDGQVLYNIPVWISTTCDDRDNAGIDPNSLEGAVMSPPTTELMHSTQIGQKGIIACPEISDYYNNFIGDWYQNSEILQYIGEYFNTLTFEQITEFDGNTVTDSPSFETGFGMGYLNQTDIDNLENSIIPSTIMSDSVLIKDIMFRLGAPIPPLVMGYESAAGLPGHLGECDAILPQYISLIEEFKEFLEIGTFFADFGIPNVSIEPTMNGLLDVRSARDLREEKINACDYIEFMTLPGGVTNGDGMYYRGNELPDEYFISSLNDRDIIEAWDCNTEFNQDLSFSRMRAVCKDGSNILIAGTGNNNFSTLNHDNTDKFFNTGRDACNSKIKLYSNQDLYYLADGDLREPLGINFFESKNTEQSSVQFLGNIIDDEFEQIPFPNLLLNGDGRLVNTNIVWKSNEISLSPGEGAIFDGVPYIPENWIPIFQFHSQQTQDGDANNSIYTLNSLEFRTINEGETDEYKNFQYGGMMPYWSSNNSQCFSRRKCLIIDTMNPSIYTGTNPLDDDTQEVYHNEWDIRQAMQTWIPTENISEDSRRKNSKYKVSFMMKTVDIKDGVNLQDTGIHVNAVFGSDDLDWTRHASFTEDGNLIDTGGVDGRNYTIRASGFQATDTNSQWPIVPFSNSQCSSNSHPKNHYDAYSGIATSVEDEYCKKSKASFTNTELNKWEKMEFTFTPRYGDTDDVFPNWDSMLMGEGPTGIKLLFMPLELIKSYENYIAREAVYGNFAARGEYFPNTGVTTSEFNQVVNNSSPGGDTDISRNGAKIYLDNFEFKEDFSFHPDVDVRKNKGLTEYGEVSLTEYSNSPDSKAPLEAQFYFYPRYNFDDIFSTDRRVMLEQFKFGQFFISDLDWGDGSPIEYIGEPFQLGVDKMLYHTYESNGVYEITATMFQIKSEEYTYNLSNPELIKYEGVNGIAHNKKFNLKIYIGKGEDEDFEYFGSTGFSFIPYENTLPIIGGLSIQSTYFKNLKRNIGILTDEDKIDINFKSLNDKLNSQHALSKVDSLFDSDLDILNIYKEPIVNTNDTSEDYLLSLPFPQYYEEFNIESATAALTQNDINLWNSAGRPDIAIKVEEFISTGNYPLISTAAQEAYSFEPKTFHNPTFMQNNVWFGGEYNKFKAELGKSIGDVDLTSIKYYNKPKSIWELFGFEEEDLNQIAKPDEMRYWKNIIPEDYSIFNREGLSHPLGIINTYSEQHWLNGSYYPVLPKYGQDGRFVDIETNDDGNVISGYPLEYTVLIPGYPITPEDEEIIYNSNTTTWNNENLEITYDSIPLQITRIIGAGMSTQRQAFADGDWVGNLETLVNGQQYTFLILQDGNQEPFIWDELTSENFKTPFPLEAPITNNSDEQNLHIKLENDKYDSTAFNDLSGNENKGFIVNDYKPKFNNKTFKPEKTQFINTIKTSKTNGAF